MILPIPGQMLCLSLLLLLRNQFDDTHLIEDPDGDVDRIDLPPLVSEVGGFGAAVVIVVVTLTKHEHIQRKQILGGVFGLEIFVAVFVGKPVDDHSVERAHHRLDWQQGEVHPPSRIEINIKNSIGGDPKKAYGDVICDEVKLGPAGQVAF